MAIRNDIYIDWDVSPRIIYVEAPSVETTMQDLYDTLRTLEAQAIAMEDASIVDASGKEDLGGGTKVGLTVQLLNAKLAFEARPGPEYVQCNISGGNLVATDLIGDTVSPIYPTAFTQIVLANSSSATLQEQSALQYASFNGGVTIDVVNGLPGTEYPAGTPQQPVNNIDDANTIGDSRGLKDFFIIDDLHLTDATPLLDDGHSFIGSGRDRSTITIDSIVNVEDAAYYDAEIKGTLDGNSRLQDCIIGDLIYVKGFIETCVLAPGTIVLAGSEEAHFLDCWSGQPGTGTPVIDMGGSGQALALRNYNGGIMLTNKSGAEAVSIDLNSGQVVLDKTIQNGEIVLRGVGTAYGIIDETASTPITPSFEGWDTTGTILLGAGWSSEIGSYNVFTLSNAPGDTGATLEQTIPIVQNSILYIEVDVNNDWVSETQASGFAIGIEYYYGTNPTGTETLVAFLSAAENGVATLEVPIRADAKSTATLNIGLGFQVGVGDPTFEAGFISVTAYTKAKIELPDDRADFGGATIINQLVNTQAIATEVWSGSESTEIAAVHDAHFNKRLWDKTGETITIYDDDGVTPLYVFDTNADMSDITPQ